MDVYKAIIARRTIRKYKQKNIEIELLKKFINAGRRAPSAANLQPLRYMIVMNEKLKQRIFKNLKFARYLGAEGKPKAGEKPVAYIIILNDMNISKNPATYDVGASAENITLSALAEGIGCCWIRSFNNKNLVKILNISPVHEIELVIALGYPAEISICEDIENNSSIKYYRDSVGTLHVPKRKLENIIEIL